MGYIESGHTLIRNTHIKVKNMISCLQKKKKEEKPEQGMGKKFVHEIFLKDS